VTQKHPPARIRMMDWALGYPILLPTHPRPLIYMYNIHWATLYTPTNEHWTSEIPLYSICRPTHADKYQAWFFITSHRSMTSLFHSDIPSSFPSV